MTTTYRSLVTTYTPPPEAVAAIDRAWYRWLAAAYPTADIPRHQQPTEPAPFPAGGHGATLTDQRGDQGTDLHLSLTRREKGDLYTTSIQLGPCPDGPGNWVLTETRVAAAAPSDGKVCAAPPFIPDLLTDLNAVKAGFPLGASGPTAIAVEDIDTLCHLLISPQRQHCVVVVADDEDARDTAASSGLDFDQVIEATYRAIAGAAEVYTIDRDGSTGMLRRLGRGFSVHRGAARVYLPGVTPGLGKDTHRHRYLTPSGYLSDDPDLLPRFAAAQVATYSTRWPVPPYCKTPPPATPTPEPADELRELALDAARQAEAQRDQVVREHRELEAQLTASHLNEMGLAEDVATSACREEALAAENSRLRQLLREHAIPCPTPLVLPTGDVPQGTDPNAIMSVSDALTAGYALPWLAWSPTAAQSIERVDTSPSAQAWGRRTWEALQALDAYCAASNTGQWTSGGFWEWLLHSGDPRVVPVEKVSMCESDTVTNHRRLAKARQFTLPQPWSWTEPTATTPSHMKPVKGGGDLIPRIYFDLRPYPPSDQGRTLPDPSRSGKLHALITFVGPHFLVPNTRS